MKVQTKNETGEWVDMMRERSGRPKLFSANCRSAKGKSTKLTTMTIDHDVICLTESHVDDTIPSRTIISCDNLVFFRKIETYMAVVFS